MLERRRHQLPNPRVCTRTKLQAQIHDDMIAEHVLKGQCACRISEHVPKGILDVHPAREDSGATTACLPLSKHA